MNKHKGYLRTDFSILCWFLPFFIHFHEEKSNPGYRERSQNKVMSKCSYSNNNRTFIQSYLVFNNYKIIKIIVCRIIKLNVFLKE